MIKILVVEDEPAVATLLSYNLTKAGYEVIIADDGKKALKLAHDHEPNLILLDWMLPFLSGIEILNTLRQDPMFYHTPIIMLTAKSSESDKLQSFNELVDDYIVKPFSLKELLARIEARLRSLGFVKDQSYRGENTSHVIQVTGDHPDFETGSGKIIIGALIVDPARVQVSLWGHIMKLGPKEFAILKFFVKRPRQVFSREQLLNHIWGHDVYVEERTIDVHILRLRKAITNHTYQYEKSRQDQIKEIIRTVRSSGYSFEPSALNHIPSTHN